MSNVDWCLAARNNNNKQIQCPWRNPSPSCISYKKQDARERERERERASCCDLRDAVNSSRNNNNSNNNHAATTRPNNIAAITLGLRSFLLVT